ncbi:MAG: hypothetical protein H0U44_05860 [Flavisolibacter sp.]|jgi:hypothetical protein|nr:hypothetical protein [Flavisolibacter sp.]
MKKVLFLFCAATSLLSAHSQTYAVQWGEDTKLKKGSLDFDIINAD